ncbi:hypothetical protein DQP58_06045 [Mycobacterium colombiense]|uniref:Uncharacterized protein n=1 Tax=Mycobacterium colombiense TaxID=339268 RepID=A0A329KRU5_9MYCO|nr:hypothetical protein [Mycobacterium colombiense]RAU98243.1 hypothetical protein DQP58_06045 [Mycobacterium colombiense]
MTNRGPLIVSAAVVLLAGGVFALYLPVFIDAYDQFGWQVKCGSGFITDLTQASSALGVGGKYVDQCDHALLIRRLWAIPAAALGGLTLTWQAGVALAHDYRRSTPSARQPELPCP